jgi:hypothetical protein
VGDGSPGSEGEGSEGFYIAQSGRYPDLLVIGGGEKFVVFFTIPVAASGNQSHQVSNTDYSNEPIFQRDLHLTNSLMTLT